MTRLITAAIFTFILLGSNTFRSSEAAKDKGHGLHVGFYNRRCPKVEQIVAEVVSKAAEADPKLPGALIRLFFHDCFVKGCDASIMLEATRSNEPVEMTSPANGGVRGFEVIDEIKARLEEECPETVSCADILAFASREAVALSGLPRHKVPAGRRDSRTSRASDVILPLPTTPVEEMIDFFTRRDLTTDDMVVLFGAHSIGTARCAVFDYRMYNFDKNQGQDPSLNPFYAAELSAQCPAPNTLPPEEAQNRVVNFDPTTPLVLDNKYYINLLQGKGLLQSDQALASDLRTLPLVVTMAGSPESFSRRFARAIIKMGRINVLTGLEGEIRKTCRASNK